jgi:long-chain acyl-CoA synthetase
MTEAASALTFLGPEDHRRGGSALTSAGRPIFGIDVRVTDAKGKNLPRGETGEVCARGGNFMREYWEKPKESEAVLRDGWYRSGDMGYFDDRHLLHLTDRLKDMIVTGGENVYSVDVERALYEHPAVRECAVIGIPDPLWVEAVHAVVVLEDGTEVTGKELSDHCHGLIAGYKCPKSFEFVAGPLPTTPVGKIRKNVLRDPWWEGQGRHI